ncbi:Putative NAD(P)H nitroreductase YdjA [Sinobacterium norvegicum]|uniref:Putative NAD(P)H nitroreductase n=1 Tax=Sinobacterium norvegicum TaxID=1641715 RepID=A0ABN8EJP9_9GAMM|nr:nitroreductase [Sinobacterium norvegicum]CAH0992683.1 Putative NAD(P)H nitroreductase YdjA [Sinobacterium norvegicum]
MSVLNALLQRNSAPRLQEPGPSPEHCQQMFQAALRAPDHGRLRPWRYLVIGGDDRAKLGEIYAQAELARDPNAPTEKLERLRGQPLRAPMVIVAIVNPTEKDGVPLQEQVISAGCGVHGLMLAAESFGYAGVWRTGPMATNDTVNQALGLASHESIVGFIYLGTRMGEAKKLPDLNTEDFVSHWQG